jgi:hypothetical protein
MTSTSRKGDSRRRKLTPEARLANYWRKRTGLPWVLFDVFQGVPQPDGVHYSRSPHWVFGPSGEDPHRDSLASLKRELAHLIAQGYPLNLAEYHLAIAFGYLLADGIPYEEFYRKHWYENAERFGYGAQLRTNEAKGTDNAEKTGSAGQR